VSLETALSTTAIPEVKKAEIKAKFSSELQAKLNTAFQSKASLVYYRGYLYDADVAKLAATCPSGRKLVIGISAAIYRGVELSGDFKLDESVKQALDASLALDAEYAGVVGSIRASVLNESASVTTELGSTQSSAESVIVPYLVKLYEGNSTP
jgi:hypothetical protein